MRLTLEWAFVQNLKIILRSKLKYMDRNHNTPFSPLIMNGPNKL